jgi:hypothetical protein
LIVYFEMSKETESEKDGDFGSVDSLVLIVPVWVDITFEPISHRLFGSLSEEPEVAGFCATIIGFAIETDMLRFLV